MLINLTPHDVTILGDSNDVIKTIAPSGTIARLEISMKAMGEIEGVKITKTCFDKIAGLPEQKENVFFIVSQMIKNSPLAIGRTDLLVPTEVVREGGTILGCKSLGC